MSTPQTQAGYGNRATQAAERVLVDLGQILASYREQLVLVGGLAPSLLFADAAPPHTSSVDVDLAMDTAALNGGQYAQLLRLLLDTGRYRLSEDADTRFRLLVHVDLKDGSGPVEVAVDFLAPKGVKMKKGLNDRLGEFRVLEADACGLAFHHPQTVTLHDQPDAAGHLNSVTWRVIAVEDLLVMKAMALAGREKKKDAYDIVFCLQQSNEAGNLPAVAASWRERASDPDVHRAAGILTEKFKSLDHIGPQWYADFLDSAGERAGHVRLAYELVQGFLGQAGLRDLESMERS